MPRILALQPYDGGSHRAMLTGWMSQSRHAWTVLSLPPHGWKWRMRHAGLHFADILKTDAAIGESEYDVIFATSMLNLAEFRGLAPAHIAHLPAVLYFHENQLTYPVRHADERDFHFVVTQLVSIAAADSVWFNSAFHRDEFAAALHTFCRSMRDHHPTAVVDRLRDIAAVEPPGIASLPPREHARRPGPLRITWAARWEHDKQPEIFFEAIRIARSRGVDMELAVLGEQFRERPATFDVARDEFASIITQFGFLESRAAYEDCLRDSDVFVSTAGHEFFGLSVVEAAACGAFPLLPERLAYPEIFADIARDAGEDCFYGQSAKDLARAIERVHVHLTRSGSVWRHDPGSLSADVQKYTWPQRGVQLDARIEAVASSTA